MSSHDAPRAAPAAPPSFEHLLSPITIGGLTLRNRLVMGSMHTGLEDLDDGLPRLAAYVAERARGGVGLIVTGGYSPNRAGRLRAHSGELSTPAHADSHRVVTDAVHREGGAVALQVLHAGRYSMHDFGEAATTRRSPITAHAPRMMTAREVDDTASAFARTAVLAQRAGYDAVEIMGSEGYLLNQFLARRTNDRTDQWGGSASRRMRLPIEVVRRTREAVGPGFPVIYRISLVDLVEDGQTWEETVELGSRLEAAGVDLLSTGVGWHEARVPTILTQVPRGAWVPYTTRLKSAVSVPVCASNRVNTPELAEQLLADGLADMVSMARPLLADPQLLLKAAEGRPEEINTCIACNQACLDHVFADEPTSCLVNPRACRETVLVVGPTRRGKRVAVVGAGPAGLATALTAAERGHTVTLHERADEVGGQFRYAMSIPGKEEFAETLRYFGARLSALGVDVRLGSTPTGAELVGYDEIVVATGVRPRVPDIAGVDHASVVSYADVLSGRVVPGREVAVVGAGGIGVDVCHWLTHDPAEDLAGWMRRWGVTSDVHAPGGLLAASRSTSRRAHRRVTLLQRKTSAVGRGLGRTSGWAHRAVLEQARVRLVSGATYRGIDDDGLHYEVEGRPHTVRADTVVLCAGQESVRSVHDELLGLGISAHVVGGADVAAELDAARAIAQGTEVGASL